MRGATACILPRFDATAAIDQITSRNATVITAVPTILDFIAREAEVRDLTLPSLRLVLSSGAGLPPPLAARLSAVCPNAEIADYYGASELSFVSVRRGQELTVPGAPSRPFHGVDIQIRRPDGSLADAGETGTVFVRSEMISDGYVRHHDDAGFRRDGDWASVGDLGFLDRAGRLHLIGRESGMLITGGLNVFPEETEAVLLAQPEVASAARDRHGRRNMGRGRHRGHLLAAWGVIELAGTSATLCHNASALQMAADACSSLTGCRSPPAARSPARRFAQA